MATTVYLMVDHETYRRARLAIAGWSDAYKRQHGYEVLASLTGRTSLAPRDWHLTADQRRQVERRVRRVLANANYVTRMAARLANREAGR